MTEHMLHYLKNSTLCYIIDNMVSKEGYSDQNVLNYQNLAKSAGEGPTTYTNLVSWVEIPLLPSISWKLFFLSSY